MMKPEFYKPFDLDAAKAGAPYCLRSGGQATVLKWDGRRENEPLVGCKTEYDIPASWRTNGVYFCNGLEGPDDLVMLPLGMIDGKPVFVGDKVEHETFTGWGRYTVTAEWREFGKCRWPVPAKAYPQTTMRHDAMFDIYSADMRGRGYTSISADSDGLAAVANAVLRHAIDTGVVIIAPKDDPADTGTLCNDQAEVAYWNFDARKKGYSEWKGRPQSERDAFKAEYRNSVADRAARDMAVAAAVRDELVASVARYSTGCSQYISSGFDFEAIIATVK